MPEFKQPYNLVTIKGIKDYDDLEVKMADSMTVAEEIEIEEMGSGMKANIEWLAKIIKDWNLTENGKKMPVTSENIKRLGLEQVTDLLGKYNKEVAALKKS